MREEFLGVLLVLGTGIAGAVLLLAAARRLAVRRSTETTPAHAISRAQRFSTKFFVAAACFALLDLEVLLLYPWAALLRDLGGYGLAAAAVFALPVGVGLVYQWRKGAFEW